MAFQQSVTLSARSTEVVMRVDAVCMAALVSIHRVPPSSSQQLHAPKHPDANKEAAARGAAVLNDVLRSHPDIADEREAAIAAYRQYEVSLPSAEDFVIGLLVNPCGANGTRGRADDGDAALGYDCCAGRFGRGEYAFRPGTRNRLSNGYSNGIPADLDAPLHDVELVDEWGNELDYRHSRRADDVLQIDEACAGLRDPHAACVADRFAASRSKVMPPCWDHNQTVDATLDCRTTAGERRSHCMQVAYSQNAYIYVCGGDFANDDSCGTYLEIHKENGTPYDDEATVLSDVKITTPVTNGMQMTTIPLSYKGDKDRILCSYDQAQIQVGSMVRVKSNAPSCCCPRWLSPTRTSRTGAFFCPKRQWSKDGGPFAPALTSLEQRYADEEFQLAFPRCPPLAADEDDDILCTRERVFADELPANDPGRHFAHPCAVLTQAEDDGLLSSADLHGLYRRACPLGRPFRGCGRAERDPTTEGGAGTPCHEGDRRFSFAGEVGRVVSVLADDSDGQEYAVSFNDGRSAYRFARGELDLLKPEGTYQLWFVQRVRGRKKIVQKKKPFRVIWPRCTFDAVNGRYFPFAQLDKGGVPIA